MRIILIVNKPPSNLQPAKMMHYTTAKFCEQSHMSLVALWDLGNVVVQWNPTRIREMTGLPEAKTDVFKSRYFEDLWLELDRGTTDEREVANKVAAETELSKVEVDLYFAAVRESLVDFTESIDLIRQMKDQGIKMYVLSNMSLVNAKYLRQRVYFQLFDGIVISAEEKLIKPDTALFQLLLDRYQLDPTKMVFMDDSLPNITAAESLGMHGVHFKATSECYTKIKRYFKL